MADTSGHLTLGVFLPGWEDQYGTAPSWSQIRDLARRAEEAGLDALWLPDHLLLTPQWGCREAWTLVAALAAATSRIQLGTLVTCTAFRQPALLALMANTLDEVSGGRLILGLGAGYPDRDLSWQAFGYATDHPVGRFEEAVEIIARLLRGERVTYQGHYYQTADAVLRLRGPRPNGPPIWIGGGGPRLQRAAVHWADAYNLRVHPGEEEVLRDTFTRVEQACREVGREPVTLGRNGFGIVSLADPASLPGRFPDPKRTRPFSGMPEEIAAQLLALRTSGVSHMACIVDDGETPGPLTQYPVMRSAGFERFLRVAEALRRLEASG
ncbi:MAG TPA: LLM class flavin-dependent oxidoreductase [Ktedonobacterales bacterium]|nr:LLM class flavin-dependent oxidoreductase [Ktedonobacterales bacterium]